MWCTPGDQWRNDFSTLESELNFHSVSCRKWTFSAARFKIFRPYIPNIFRRWGVGVTTPSPAHTPPPPRCMYDCDRSYSKKQVNLNFCEAFPLGALRYLCDALAITIRLCAVYSHSQLYSYLWDFRTPLHEKLRLSNKIKKHCDWLNWPLIEDGNFLTSCQQPFRFSSVRPECHPKRKSWRGLCGKVQVRINTIYWITYLFIHVAT